eukprot:COSAG01_NODE_4712_length_4798_cov_3.005959_2_plen_323_part_00
MLLSGAAIREESVASGVFAAWASQDGGAVYRPAGGPGSVGPSQSVDAFFQEGVPYFVITGDTLTHNGVAVSRDGGLTFEAGIDVFDDKTIEANIGARYGAFPSSNAWYVSGGRWPSNDADADPGLHSLSENVAVTKPRNGSDAAWRPLSLKFTHPTSQRRRRAQDPSDPFTAGVSKSTDSGATWHTVYESDTSGYYFNQITCWDDDRCAVVAEGGGAARILVTSDGGLTWRQTLDATGSLMAIEALSAGGSSPGEGWAGGGVLGIIQFTGHYWHTLDFGETWALTELTGAYCFDLSFAPGQNEVGFSTVLTPSVSRLARYGA